jgi:hypothetical protein
VAAGAAGRSIQLEKDQPCLPSANIHRASSPQQATVCIIIEVDLLGSLALT